MQNLVNSIISELEYNCQDYITDKKLNEDKDKSRNVLTLSLARNKLFRRAERVKNCGHFLDFVVCENSDHIHLASANFCGDILCPVCAKKRARQNVQQLTSVLTKAFVRNPFSKVISLTLTVKNCSGVDLKETYSKILRAWSKLTRRKEFEGIKGWFRSLETVYSKDRQDWHPHLHILLFVNRSYFYGKYYHTQAEWMAAWAGALGLPPGESVDVFIKSLNPRDFKQTYYSIAVEAAKYACKSADYLSGSNDEIDEKVGVLAKALHNTRLISQGGLFRELWIEVKRERKKQKDYKVCPVCGGALYKVSYEWQNKLSQYIFLYCVAISPPDEAAA